MSAQQTVLDLLADRLHVMDQIKAANGSAAPVSALIFAVEDLGIDPMMPVTELARLIRLGQAVETLRDKLMESTMSGLDALTSLRAIYAEAERGGQ